MKRLNRGDRLALVITAATLILAIALMLLGSAGVFESGGRLMGYEGRLFDASAVHTVDITMDGWDAFIETCESEEYSACDVVIDGERLANVAIRAKGNTSLSNVKSLNSQRYSFKIEFDHYDGSTTYHGLDKLSLNNIIQDNTFMKDFLAYQMMGFFGVDAPLCSFVYITVNGEDWGLYLAVEGVEDAFLRRNYGSDYGELYKPDSMSFGGGRGNGRDFDMDEMMENFNPEDLTFSLPETDSAAQPSASSEQSIREDRKNRENRGEMGGKGGGMSMGSSDTKLQYIDDDPSSYANIFDNAKTDITDADSARLIRSLKKLGESEDLESVVNIDEVMRYFVVHNFLCNFDSYTGSIIHNYYLYEENGQLSMIPWDYNLAFGSFQASGDATEMVNYPIDSPVSGGSTEDRPMVHWIFASEEYLAMYHEYFDRFLAEYFENGYFTTRFETTAALIAPYVERDPTKFCTTEEFEAGVAALREFCSLRAESIRGQLDGKIPSTSQGQTDSAALIDGSHVNISDMGSMGGGMGGGPNMNFGDRENMPEKPQGGGMPQMPADGGMPQMPTAETTAADTAAPSGDMPEMPEGGFRFPTDGEMPDMGNFPGFTSDTSAGSTAAVNADTAITLGVSVLILLLGILFAWKYRRR